MVRSYFSGYFFKVFSVFSGGYGSKRCHPGGPQVNGSTNRFFGVPGSHFLTKGRFLGIFVLFLFGKFQRPLKPLELIFQTSAIEMFARKKTIDFMPSSTLFEHDFNFD